LEITVPYISRKLAFWPCVRYDAAHMAKPKVGKGRKIKTSIYLDEDRLKALKSISDKTLIAMSVLIRKGIDLVIAEYSKTR
jgi:Ribbon-helix-helix domain